jgi:hypothetical protein
MTDFHKEFLKDLPLDPNLAVLELVKRYRNVPTDPVRCEAMVRIIYRFAHRIGFDAAYNERANYIENAKGLVSLADKIQAQEESKNRKRQIHRSVELAEALIEGYAEEVTGTSFGYARLDPEQKDIISKKLSEIRCLIDESNLANRKKSALFDRISALQTEVNADLTATDRFFSFLGDLAFAVGGMAEKAKPAIEQTKDVLKIVMRARAKEERIQLPPEIDFPQLPAPQDEDA